MGRDETEITFCPRCRRMVEARDYMNPWVLGMLDSVLPNFSCRCGYNGLAITLPKEDYVRIKPSRRPSRKAL
jgi:hypothetical protein